MSDTAAPPPQPDVPAGAEAVYLDPGVLADVRLRNQRARAAAAEERLDQVEAAYQQARTEIIGLRQQVKDRDTELEGLRARLAEGEGELAPDDRLMRVVDVDEMPAPDEVEQATAAEADELADDVPMPLAHGVRPSRPGLPLPAATDAT
jgi:hypothetical protein